MNKKLGIFSLISLSALTLSGCTIPGVPDPQEVADQTRMLVEMQQQMSNVLSGMQALQQQNDQMSGVLLKLEAYIEAQKASMEKENTAIHGVADPSDPMLFGGTGSSNGQPSTGWLSAFDFGWEVFNGEIDTGSIVSTGSSEPVLSGESRSILEELKKAANKKNGSGDHTSTVNSGILE